MAMTPWWRWTSEPPAFLGATDMSLDQAHVEILNPGLVNGLTIGVGCGLKHRSHHFH
ncbi:MAG: hypothetical protein ACLFVO_27120 [Chloroflexaceae bacterium]